MAGTSTEVVEEYEKLRREGQATVDNIVKWMKEAKVLETVKKTEAEAAEMFNDVPDKSQVTQEKFKEVLQQMAENAKLTSEQLYSQMAQASARFVNAVAAVGAALSASLLGNQPQNSNK